MSEDVEQRVDGRATDARARIRAVAPALFTTKGFGAATVADRGLRGRR